MARYFLDLSEGSAPLPWDPHTGPHPLSRDTRYFGGVFRALEPLLADPALDFYLTRSWSRLPDYGERVVAVVLADEAGHVPLYSERVRAVFKCYGTRPAPGVGPWRDPSLTGWSNLAQFGFRGLRWLPGGARHALERGRGGAGRVATIPLGTYNQVELPIVPIAERATDVFFAGSVEHLVSPRHLGSPKARARRDMLRALDELGSRRPDLRVDVRVTQSFEASAASSVEAYSQALMNAKVCLAPRGTSVETFRLFEGLRAGCVVAAGGLPPHSFYAGAPILELDRWRELPELLPPLLDSPERLEALHAGALRWWRERCSEAAVARLMARVLTGVAPADPD